MGRRHLCLVVYAVRHCQYRMLHRIRIDPAVTKKSNYAQRRFDVFLSPRLGREPFVYDTVLGIFFLLRCVLCLAVFFQG